jgi:2-polyprenyl-3-methyl-5-hydroxy-6-metoxy-1,4-benzoquinol methylase
MGGERRESPLDAVMARTGRLRAGLRTARRGTVNYQLAYRIRFHPWEDAEGHAPFVEKFSELLGEEERGRDAPYGAALDLGTGSGIWAIQLAKRGWQVTAVDLVDKALQRARERVDAAGVEVELVHGDVTALREAGVGSGFRRPSPSSSARARPS